MKFLDRFLPLWIFLSMPIGLFLGVSFPQIVTFYSSLEFQDINLAIVFGLIIMMYPPLAKADYARVFKIFDDKKLLFISLNLNWLVGPILMFILALLAYLLLPNFGIAYMQGVILIGLARCIAMVLVWVEISLGDKNYALGLVAFNSLFQILFFSVYAYIFMILLPSFLGIELHQYSISMLMVAKNVGIYLGIPFVLGALSRLILVRYQGLEFYEKVFIPRISPLSLIALLYIIIVMFSYKGESLITLPLDVLLVALLLVAYFIIMFFISFYKNKGFGYTKCSAVSFSACGNNFELNLAVVIASFGIDSGQAFASIVGVLIEVPIMIVLASWLKRNRWAST